MPTGFHPVEAVLPHLPGYESAYFSDDRLVTHVLNPKAKEGKGSPAVLFERVLAIEGAHVEYLREQLVEGLAESPAILHKENEYGQAWEVPALVTGRNGRNAYVVEAWFIEVEASVPRFLTARVARPNEIATIRAHREAFGYPIGAFGAALEDCGAERGLPRLSHPHRGRDSAHL
jgi:hypothetical protein